MEYMNSRYYECEFMVSQQRKEQVLWDWRRVMRYLNKEVRVPEFPVIAKEIKLADKKYLVKPDLVFRLCDFLRSVRDRQNNTCQNNRTRNGR